jgi:hypothetical protein
MRSWTGLVNSCTWLRLTAITAPSEMPFITPPFSTEAHARVAPYPRKHISSCWQSARLKADGKCAKQDRPIEFAGSIRFSTRGRDRQPVRRRRHRLHLPASAEAIMPPGSDNSSTESSLCRGPIATCGVRRRSWQLEARCYGDTAIHFEEGRSATYKQLKSLTIKKSRAASPGFLF